MFGRTYLVIKSYDGIGAKWPLGVASRRAPEGSDVLANSKVGSICPLSLQSGCRWRTRLRMWGNTHERLHLAITRAAASADPNPDPVPATAPAQPASTKGKLSGLGTQTQPTDERGTQTGHDRLEQLRIALLAALSSLDRGLAANAREATEVDELCGRIEALGGSVTLAPTGRRGGRDLLSGTWRLIYSSGFNSGSLGGRRPGPPAALFPTVLGQVYQRIDPDTAQLDNIVELLFNYGPPDWGLLGLGEEALGRGITGLSRQLGMEITPEQLPPPLREILKGPHTEERGQQWPWQTSKRESPAAWLTLRHDYEVTSPATVRIVYEETYGELVGSDLFTQLPRMQVPSLPEPLRPPKFLRSATFEVTFLDETLRITRGDRGELRVYLRDTAADVLVSGAAGATSAEQAIALDYDD